MRRCTGIRRACLTASVALALLAAPAGAEAETFCVNDTACASSGGTPESTIQAAFAAATLVPSPSTVSIGPGSYGGSPMYENSKQITVVGAGEGQTTITASGSASGLSVGGNSSDRVSSMSIDVTQTGMTLAAGLTTNETSADHIAVTLSGSGGAGFVLGPGTVTDSTVTATPGDTTAIGVDVEGGPAIIQDSTFSGVSIGVAGGSPLIMQRDTIDATDRGVECFGVCSVQDTVLSMAAGSSFGLVATCSGSSTDASATNDTIVGPVASSVAATCPLPGLHAGVSIDSSIIRGGDHALQVAATDGAATATITPTYDDYDPATDAVGGGPGAETIAQPGVGQINADPLFVDAGTGDYRVPGNSPVVDEGNPAPLSLIESTTDLGGLPRVVNGRRDIGAFEYQRRPPTASITEDVHTAAAGHPVHFDASHSTDPDPGDTLTYAWHADDGASGSGVTFAHAFTKPGGHTVTLTVTDPAGLTATASATVTVTAASPSITQLRESHKRWRVGAGTTFRFRLSADATVRLVFRRHGHKVAGLTRRGHAGVNRIHVTGRLKHGKRLGAGRYTVTFTAANSAGASKPRSLKFRVL